MPTTNGHEVETGCYAEGHRGWYVGDRVIDVATDLGWELDDEGRAAVEVYYRAEESVSPEEYGNIAEVVTGQGGVVDEAQEWLNEHTPMECLNCHKPMEWRDGLMRAIHTNTGRMYCRVEGVGNYPMGRPQSYLWHFRDGEFFLSRICDDEENCTDEECAHWD